MAIRSPGSAFGGGPTYLGGGGGSSNSNNSHGGSSGGSSSTGSTQPAGQGYYSFTKGGFVTTTGGFYPSSDPSFVPRGFQTISTPKQEQYTNYELGELIKASGNTGKVTIEEIRNNPDAIRQLETKALGGYGKDQIKNSLIRTGQYEASQDPAILRAIAQNPAALQQLRRKERGYYIEANPYNKAGMFSQITEKQNKAAETEYNQARTTMASDILTSLKKGDTVTFGATLVTLKDSRGHISSKYYEPFYQVQEKRIVDLNIGTNESSSPMTFSDKVNAKIYDWETSSGGGIVGGIAKYGALTGGYIIRDITGMGKFVKDKTVQYYNKPSDIAGDFWNLNNTMRAGLLWANQKIYKKEVAYVSHPVKTAKEDFNFIVNTGKMAVFKIASDPAKYAAQGTTFAIESYGLTKAAQGAKKAGQFLKGMTSEDTLDALAKSKRASLNPRGKRKTTLREFRNPADGSSGIIIKDSVLKQQGVKQIKVPFLKGTQPTKSMEKQLRKLYPEGYYSQNRKLPKSLNVIIDKNGGYALMTTKQQLQASRIRRLNDALRGMSGGSGGQKLIKLNLGEKPSKESLGLFTRKAEEFTVKTSPPLVRRGFRSGTFDKLMGRLTNIKEQRLNFLKSYNNKLPVVRKNYSITEIRDVLDDAYNSRRGISELLDNANKSRFASFNAVLSNDRKGFSIMLNNANENKFSEFRKLFSEAENKREDFLANIYGRKKRFKYKVNPNPEMEFLGNNAKVFVTNSPFNSAEYKWPLERQNIVNTYNIQGKFMDFSSGLQSFKSPVVDSVNQFLVVGAVKLNTWQNGTALNFGLQNNVRQMNIPQIGMATSQSMDIGTISALSSLSDTLGDTDTTLDQGSGGGGGGGGRGKGGSSNPFGEITPPSFPDLGEPIPRRGPGPRIIDPITEKPPKFVDFDLIEEDKPKKKKKKVFILDMGSFDFEFPTLEAELTGFKGKYPKVITGTEIRPII